MKITRTSTLTGITRTKDLDITEKQLASYNNGSLLQEAFPQLNMDDREFIKNGITGEEWDQLFGAAEEVANY